MSYKVKERPEKTETRSECCHYWVIEMADGPISRGVCKFCGEEKWFMNYFWGSSDTKQSKGTFVIPGSPESDEPDEEW